MRLVRFGGGKTGLLLHPRGEAPLVLDATGSLGSFGQVDRAAAELLGEILSEDGSSWLPLIRQWNRARAPLRSLLTWAESRTDGAAATHPLRTITLEPPLPDRTHRIFALGGNFAAHLEAAAAAINLSPGNVTTNKDETPPWGFFIIPGTVVGPEAVITPPQGVRKLDYEAEVAVVLGSSDSGTPADGSQIWGVTAWNDFSIRDKVLGLSTTDTALGIARVDRGSMTWSLQKNFASGNACGPWMVVDEDLDPSQIGIKCHVNGELRQSGSTKDMVYSFMDTARHLSAYLPLRAGDMILSGTPAGTAVEGGVDGPFLRDGDVTEVEIEGVGLLRNRIEWYD